MESAWNFTDRKLTKKDRIISCFLEGITEIAEIAKKADARPSYVASVLQQKGLIKGYFDLYTSTKESMNIYSKLFAHRLGFKNIKIAQQSIKLLEKMYTFFHKQNDHVGQHHALNLALTMFHRAIWIGKKAEATIFHNWLVTHLDQEMIST